MAMLSVADGEVVWIDNHSNRTCTSINEMGQPVPDFDRTSFMKIYCASKCANYSSSKSHTLYICIATRAVFKGSSRESK